MFIEELQFMFAEGGDEGGDNTSSGGNNTDGESTPTFTNETFNDWVKTDDGKKALQPHLDKYFTKGLDSWKENNLEKIYQERYAAENPGETKEMKMIRELQAKLSKQEAQAHQAEMNGVAINELSEKNLPVEFAEYLRGTTAEETKMNVLEFENLFNKHVQAFVEGKIKPTKTEAMPENKGTKDKYKDDPFMAAFTYNDRFHNND